MADSHYQLAQVNIARMRAPLDSPVMADFVARLDEINTLADNSPGFVWRLQTPDGDATALRVWGDDAILINMSVWQSLEALRSYVYEGAHLEVMRRRREWFARFGSAHLALWWLPAGQIPTVEDAKLRVQHLDQHGPTAHAFTFARPFAAPDRAEPLLPAGPAICPA